MRVFRQPVRNVSSRTLSTRAPLALARTAVIVDPLSAKLRSRPPWRPAPGIQFHQFCTAGPTLSDEELASEMQEFQNLFVEARLCIEDARESLDTTYYEEDLEVAKEATAAAVDAFKSILSRLDAERADSLKAGNGMKVAQLEAELAEVAEHYKDDH